ncbi:MULTISPECIES: sugar phosphate isomerase/epimerase family protein [Microbacterium]|jgi:D-psicose/D-tagatose/L-ribulose 3-epimerase|uniref:sugar phosphate isomerase/epimerase family protein n=1 Tax=Microbacterium TaxID=33882 RepID=UPI0023DB95A5|nr:MULTISPECIES: sugar phosphate isomerase/epimerase family protein [Microbacterium]MDF2048148.1 sugar phosphate isomerase/epimerase [Microbacterium sp. Kw_RZR3]MDF2916436.1 L-ribulose 3-epimerase [Microbacterium sp.]MDQ1075512.1 D-psicose/D-tagatose/L-ribulose 3-epimerase [Microbacterium sp. SORGH_AS_0969]MDQ1115750.1 D-psicose/D-tagatose/L-ribulose 3-epimerase [Microbacterium testaceum]
MNQVLPLELDAACHLNVFVATMDDDGVEAALDTIAEAGFRRVVLPPLDPDATDLDRVRRLLQGAHLAPITIAGQDPSADVSSDDEDVRARGIQVLHAALDLTVALGGDQMNGVPYGLLGHARALPDPGRVERIARDIGIVADRAAAEGVTMTLEVLNRYETNVVNTAADAMDFVARSGSENLFLHLDTFHMAIEEESMRGAIRTALPRLRYLELGQSGRGVFGDGAVDIEGVVRDALDEGYEGRWGVESFSRPGIPEAVADMLAVWRRTFDRGADVVEGVVPRIRRGWAASVVGRRVRRLERIEPAAAR